MQWCIRCVVVVVVVFIVVIVVDVLSYRVLSCIKVERLKLYSQHNGCTRAGNGLRAGRAAHKAHEQAIRWGSSLARTIEGGIGCQTRRR